MTSYLFEYVWKQRDNFVRMKWKKTADVQILAHCQKHFQKVAGNKNVAY
jgi:hypothetical protein